MATKADVGRPRKSDTRRVLLDAFIAVVIVAAFLVPLAEVYSHGLLDVRSAAAILLAALALVGVWRTLPLYRPASAPARTRAARFEQASAGSRSSPAKSRDTTRETSVAIPSGAAGPLELPPHGKREAIGAGAAPAFRATFELEGEPNDFLPRLLVALDRAPHFRIASTNEERSELTAEYRTVWTEGNLKVQLAPQGGRTLLTATAMPSAKILDAFESACAASVKS